MSESRRCFKCGRIEGCEGYVRGRNADGVDAWVPCPDCEDGWGEAEEENPFERPEDQCTLRSPETKGKWVILGTDAETLCPRCKEE